jgi:hypothetical protein
MHAGGLAEGVTRLPEKGGLRCAKRTYLGNRIADVSLSDSACASSIATVCGAATSRS